MKDSIRKFLSTFLHYIAREIETTKTVSSITNLKIQRYRDFLYDKNYILQDGQHLTNFINLFDIQGSYHDMNNHTPCNNILYEGIPETYNIHNVIYRIIHNDIEQLTDFFNEHIDLFNQLKEYMKHEEEDEDVNENENDEENVKGYVFK
jgi:hypothetical protein